MKGLRSRLRSRRQRPRRGLPVEEGHGIDENTRYWDTYAGVWTSGFRGYEHGTGEQRESYTYLGEEWGNPKDVAEILEAWMFPQLTDRTIALEIGSGGGRIAGQVAPRVQHLYCLDVSVEMLKKLAEAMEGRDNVTLLHVPDAVFPSELTTAGLDFIYSFDVFVHLDLHTQWKYIRQIGEVLRPGGMAFLHTTNLTTAAGWQRFSAQSRATLDGHFFVVPEEIRLLAAKAGLSVEKESSEDPSNFYAARDYLVLLRK
jgi:SAM-dependent methyltransferase